MKIAVYGRGFSGEARPYLENLEAFLIEKGAEIQLFRDLQQFVESHCQWQRRYASFANHSDLQAWNPDFLISLGGDGTILDATTLIRDSGIPIIGINTGRLGFLSNVGKEEIAHSLAAVWTGNYRISERSLINVECESLALEMPFALNEVSLSRKDTTAMVTVELWIDGNFLNAYWADGLIVATPTGSTGYSLSCNGPIIMPGSECFVLTPIAPHNLTARPVVIPDHSVVRMRVSSRESQNLLSLDSRIYSIGNGVDIYLRKAPFRIGMVEAEDHHFAQTLRNKFMWGMDQRN